METWFECRVKYLKIDQGGCERKVSDLYLLDAVSFTDAETRMYEKMQEMVRGDFQVLSVKKSNITEILSQENGEWWFKAKIQFVTIDESSGREVKGTSYVLVMADDIDEALKRVREGLSYMLMPYVLIELKLSPIADVFPFEP
jgi:hypothetical protein